MNGRFARGILLVIATATLAFIGEHASAQDKPNPSDALLGEWWTEGNEGRVRFTRYRDGTYRGTTTCCAPAKPTEDNPGRDIHNPNPKLRSRSTVGIILIWKLQYDGEGEYIDGYVYNPRDGKTYRFEAKVIDQRTLKIRGYAGISLFGQSQIWKRVQPDPKAVPQPTTATR